MLKPRAAREGAGSEPGEILARTATLRAPVLVPMQSVHEERVASSACPAAQHRMRPTFLITKKGLSALVFIARRIVARRAGGSEEDTV